MATTNINSELIRLRDLSSAFSRSAFVDVLNYNDYSHFNWLVSKYNTLKCVTYFDLLKKSYSLISKDYRCEYVYKNELIKLLLKKYGTRNSVFYSEFKVGNSIADMVMFNGESKAFEIKTEYDTPRRLDKQMENYKCFFDKCYIVVPENRLEEYCNIIDSTIGIIAMSWNNGHIVLKDVRSAHHNERFDPRALMSCLRTDEYKNIVLSLGISLDGVNGYDMYKFCYNVILQADSGKLRELFLCEVKKRKNNTSLLRKYPMPIRQMMLSLNLSADKANKLLEQLNININQE
ncbi:MAG: sce7726 family protein [Bacteroidetes bacterium]|uniref:Sce7726 family protein n=1 Tax=Candidatus Gallipaludibacter merdavium TaxID=2840839 RepID=A0A9D9HU85_9BACT|nr:sce7726 family protein [Candidatus Gallipaludibacter merdavium]